MTFQEIIWISVGRACRGDPLCSPASADKSAKQPGADKSAGGGDEIAPYEILSS
jgi:hypothetical protein